MNFRQEKETCDNCWEKGYKEPKEYTSMETSPGNKIVWYECGHVLIIKNDVVCQQFNFADK